MTAPLEAPTDSNPQPLRLQCGHPCLRAKQLVEKCAATAATWTSCGGHSSSISLNKGWRTVPGKAFFLSALIYGLMLLSMLCLLPECAIWLGYQISLISHESPKRVRIFLCGIMAWSWCLAVSWRQDAGPGADVITYNAAMAACKSLVGTNMNKPGTRNGHVAWPWLVCSLHSKKSLPIAGGKTSIPLQVCTLERKYILYINMSMTVYVNSYLIYGVWFSKRGRDVRNGLCVCGIPISFKI